MRHVVLVLLALAVGCGDGGSRAELIPLDQVPEPLLKTAQKTLPEVKFDHARKMANGNYEVRGKARNGKVREVELSPAGEVVEIE